ncbi:MAG: LON peptidase substrate-binding domain-containing protein [Bdellovibrionales bacterium]|nr:LON peptidase substrate-binding domain-containing protein [Bdellovibrionales bacterium]
MEVLLLPLVNVTLFPRTTKPLNIFEPRYLDLVRDSVQNQKPIAIAFVEEAQAQKAPVVGEIFAGIRAIAGFGQAQIIEERSNGTLLVFVQGLGKVKLGVVKDFQRGYVVCEAEQVLENQELDESVKPKLDDLRKILTRWIHAHIPDPAQQELFLKNVSGPEEVVGAFSSYLVRDYDLQQMVLEFDNINEKVRFLFRLIESAEVTA